MFILQRMASSTGLLLNPPLVRPISPNVSPHRFFLAVATQFAGNRDKSLFHSKKANGFSSSVAVATDSSTTSVSTQNEDLVETQKEESEKVVLPTNESSEKLLRIRHTVIVNILVAMNLYCNLFFL